jgi:hypothetical protein
MTTRTASWAAFIVIAFAAACGPETPPESAATEAPAPAAAEPAPAAAAPAAASPGGAEENWEGEAAAKNAAPGPAGTDSAGNPTTDGKVETRTMTQIQKLVQDNRQPVRDCLDKECKTLPDLHGDMVITFVVDAEGKVKSAQLNQERSTMKAPPVVECAITVIKGLKFPPSSRGMDTTVNYPYNFAKR